MSKTIEMPDDSEPHAREGARSPAYRGLTEAARAGRLELQTCRECATVQYPPREVCRRCLSADLAWCEQPRGGMLVAATAIHRPYEKRFEAAVPVRIGLVAMDGGPVVVAFLDGVCAPDDRVTLDLRLDATGEAVFHACGD